MQATEIVKQLKEYRTAAHLPIVWRRNAKTKKDCTVHIEKRTCAYVRTGIDYANTKKVLEGIIAGEREEVGSLPWGHWRKGFENYILDHTPKGETMPVEYIRLYPASFDNLKAKIVSEWLVNGVVSTFDDCKVHLLKSEFPTDETPECFTVKARDIISVG